MFWISTMQLDRGNKIKDIDQKFTPTQNTNTDLEEEIFDTKKTSPNSPLLVMIYHL